MGSWRTGPPIERGDGRLVRSVVEAPRTNMLIHVIDLYLPDKTGKVGFQLGGNWVKIGPSVLNSLSRIIRCSRFISLWAFHAQCMLWLWCPLIKKSHFEHWNMSKIGNEAIESPQYQIGSLDYTKELILLLREHSDPKSSMYYKGGGILPCFTCTNN